jgi:MFS family permease
VTDDIRDDSENPPAGEPVDNPVQWNARTLFQITGTTVLLPNIFFGLGEGAVIPIIPLFATQTGAGLAVAALAAAMLPLGELVASVPAGWLVGRIGERNGMYWAALISAVGSVVCWMSANIGILICGVFLIGVSSAMFALARHSFVTVAVPLSHRGRGLSLMGGSSRLGILVGPFISAVVIHTAGDVRPAWAIPVIASAAIALTLWFCSDEGALDRIGGDPMADISESSRVWETFKSRRDVLFRVGVAAGLINTMRISRQIIVPLIGLTLDLPPATITTFVGICATVDFALFYVGGQLMDRFGRLWVAVPTMLAFAVSHVVLAISDDLDEPILWYVGASVLMSVGNGVTSGIVATMGSDLADQRAPAAFLGSWRLITQLGPAGAPFIISALTGLFSVAVATFAMAGTSLVGALVLIRYVPRYLPKLSGGPH